MAPDLPDLTRPAAARMYDYYLGGKDNLEVDRDAADALFQRIPELRTMARANRMFLGRAVRAMAEAGITQFIDIGAGLPAQNPTHQVAGRWRPGAHVVYVDFDPMVCSHARSLLATEAPSATTVIRADLREPQQILTHPDLGALIDPTKPVGLLLVAVLHFLRDEDRPYDTVAALRDALAPGSQIAISHVENQSAPERARYLEEIYEDSSSPGQTRSRAEIGRFFDGLEVVAPGLVHVAAWRPDLALPAQPGSDHGVHGALEHAWVYGGLGRVPAPADPAGPDATVPPAEA